MAQGSMEHGFTALALIDAHLYGAYLGSAELKAAYLLNARLLGANLSGARLQGAVLDKTRLEGAELELAELQGALLQDVTVWNVGPGNAKLDEVSVVNPDFAAPSEAELEGLKNIIRKRVPEPERGNALRRIDALRPAERSMSASAGRMAAALLRRRHLRRRLPLQRGGTLGALLMPRRIPYRGLLRVLRSEYDVGALTRQSGNRPKLAAHFLTRGCDGSLGYQSLRDRGVERHTQKRNSPIVSWRPRTKSVVSEI